MDRIVDRFDTSADTALRPAMVVLGVGLGILWLVGLGYHATAWMVWIELALACASILSVLAPDRMESALRAAPYAIGAALVILWIVGLVAGAQTWLSWWTFGFGMAYLFAGVALGMTVASTTRAPGYRTTTGTEPAPRSPYTGEPA